MIRIGLDWWNYHNSLLLGKTRWEEVLRRARHLGCAGVAIEYFALPAAWRKDAAPLVDACREMNLEVVFGFGLPLMVNDAAWRLAHEHCDRALLIAQQLGARVLRLQGPIALSNRITGPVHLRYSRDSERQTLVRRVKEFCRRATERELLVAVENQGRFGAEDLLRLADLTDEQNLRFVFHSGNAVAQGRDPYHELGLLAPRVVYLRLVDVQGHGAKAWPVPLGDGRIDILTLLRLARRAGYEGLCSPVIDLPIWSVSLEEDRTSRAIGYLSEVDIELRKEKTI